MNESTVDILRKFAAARPNLEPGNYSSAADYRREARAIQKQLRDARAILSACERLNIGPDAWRDAMATDRLKIANGRAEFDVCQYWPTEYRLAVCRVGKSAIWSHLRDAMGCKTRDEIQLAAREYLPSSIVRRWFN
jgi:hypothetical protein